jgi:hypothetical protein
MSKHVILYIPGLGDRDLSGRRSLLSLWHYRNVRIEVCPMDWTVDEPWQQKLNRLLQRITELHDEGNLVALIGESAGATAVIQALAQRTDELRAVILLCGKSQFPERVAPARYHLNPAFKDALILSAAAVSKLTTEQKAKMLNLHPLIDMVVPVSETKISGVKDSYMPSVGHAFSIFFANIFWNWRIVRFVKKLS